MSDRVFDGPPPFTWFVIRKKDTEEPEMLPFRDEAEARSMHERMSMQWSECFLLRVVNGPGVKEGERVSWGG